MTLAHVADGEVQNAGRLLIVCTGEARAFAGAGDDHKVASLGLATVVSVKIP